jgi:uncharacterized membrane protein YfcA
MDITLGTIVVLGALAAFGSFVYGVTGFGSGLLTISLASHFYDLKFVLAVYSLIDCINAIRVCFARPKDIVRDEAVRLLPSCVAGVALGAVLILALPAWILMLALGIFVAGYGIYSIAFSHRLPTIGMQWAYAAGVAGGVTSAMFGAGGPPYAIYLSMRPHPKEAIRATLAATSLVSIGTRLVAFGFAGLLASAAVWLTAACIAPAALIALWCADRVHAAVSRETLIRAIRVLLCAAGISLVVRALA